MKKADVRVGGVYEVRVSGRLARVRIDCVHTSSGWYGTNLDTGHQVRIRTAGRLRKPVGIAPPTSPADLWRQWQALKASNPGTVLLFLVNGQYEALGVDAHFAAAILGLEVGTLPFKPDGIHVVRFPETDLAANIGRLVAAGHRVAVCERVQPGKPRGKPVEKIIIPV